MMHGYVRLTIQRYQTWNVDATGRIVFVEIPR